MGHSPNTFADLKSGMPAHAAAGLQPEDVITQEERRFLKQYDEALNKHVLHVFRKTSEEYARAHDHRAVKIIEGELVNLRLDSLNGQADGIKATFEKRGQCMYIWFQPECETGNLLFKILWGDYRKRLRIKPDDVTHDFLLELIGKILKLAKREKSPSIGFMEK